MKYNNLHDNNIFAVPVGDVWNVDSERLLLLYAPLNGSIALGTKDSVARMESCAGGLNDDENQKRILSSFQASGKVPVHRLPATPHDLYQIDILANYTCNFKCVYCYSAAGRSSGQITFDKIRTVVDYLFRSGKKQKNPYIINFSGGGEPLLSFPLIRQTVEYIESVTKGTDYKYNIGLVTNGSLITPEILDFLQEHRVDMAVSFEILERLQNKERGSYDKVAANLDMMLERKYPFGIRTTFTPESVGCMTEMIETLHDRFPGLRRVVYDTVLAPSLFDSPASLEKYYDDFLDGFYKAKVLASNYGIQVDSVAVEMLSLIRDRTCDGKIVLTPTGSVSSCARVSSTKESLYDEYVYGEVENDRLVFDQDRFSKIIGENNIYSQKECGECFAKWNCGGGCRLFHHSFSPEYESVRCRFVRKSLKRQLLETLAERFRSKNGKDFFTHVKEQIANDTV